MEGTNMLNFIKRIFELPIRLSKHKVFSFEVYKVRLTTEINYRGYFVYEDDRKEFCVWDKGFHIFGRKTDEGKRRAKQVDDMIDSYIERD